MAFNMIEFLASQSNKTSDTIAQLGRKGIGANTLPTYYQDELQMWDCRQQVSTYVINDSFILDHPDNATLGTSKLGNRNSVPDIFLVYNAHGIFPEGFWNERFHDTVNTTADWSTGSCTFATGSIQDMYTTSIPIAVK